ncbi:ABC transporter permease [Halobacterium litoreum]|uniref:ABC transporter permease n=1 Tax=Halobacterium litoreum TaxID=2039234 RepID=A0ABD5NGI7_9EURY|nr:ABC transporter permease [Halobacterium litoreum]UHH12787.1 ABC transporter permease [Halobacterium litoreum]
MSWLTYAARRTAFAAFTALLVVSLTFLVVRYAPNTDLTARLVGLDPDSQAAQEIRRQYRRAHGTTGTLAEQYVRYMTDVVTLDWGFSYEFDRPVADILAETLPRTLAYVVPGVVIAYTVGVLGGLASAYRGRVSDWTLRIAAYVGLGVPSIVLGIVVVKALAGEYPWLADPVWNTHPFLFRGSPSFRGTEPWRSVGWKYLLPAAVLAVGLVSGLFRHTRNNALSYKGSDTSKMLNAKGANQTVNARHALRNAALPLLSVSFAELMSVLALGAFVVETVFRIPGVAAYLQVAVYTRDFRLVVGAATVFALIGVVGSLAQDLLYGYLDPRVGE